MQPAEPWRNVLTPLSWPVSEPVESVSGADAATAPAPAPAPAAPAAEPEPVAAFVPEPEPRVVPEPEPAFVPASAEARLGAVTNLWFDRGLATLPADRATARRRSGPPTPAPG